MPHFFTNRSGGSSVGAYESLNFGFHVGDDNDKVIANRATLSNTQFMDQVHSDQIVEIDRLQDAVPKCDGLITSIPGINLAVMVADCIPLLLISKSVVAAVHVGRAGLLNGIALKALRLMQKKGATDVRAVMGPSICGYCYEVPIKLQQEVLLHHPAAVAETRIGSASLNLPKALSTQLHLQGIETEISQVCTMEDEMYFSHRRNSPTGRFVGVVSL